MSQLKDINTLADTLHIHYRTALTEVKRLQMKYPDNDKYSLSFDGVDDYTHVYSSLAEIGYMNTYTVSLWVKSNAETK